MNFKSTIPIFLVSAILSVIFWNCKKESPTNDPANPSTTVTDIDGNIYHTVTIGTQVWMVENLKTTKYRNGVLIPYVTTEAQWSAQTSGGYTCYNNDVTNRVTYGYLYNWYAVIDSRMIAPQGWHIPTKAEWAILVNNIGGIDMGGKLKEAGTVRWQSPNKGADNSSGFTALPGGMRDEYGLYWSLGQSTWFWSTDDYSATQAWGFTLQYGNTTSSNFGLNKKVGWSVRCLKD